MSRVPQLSLLRLAVLVFQQFAGHVLSLLYTHKHTPHSRVTNWLNEPPSQPFPVHVCPMCLFNSSRKQQSWDRAVLHSFLFISWGKVHKGNKTAQLLIWKKDSKVCTPNTKPQTLHRTTVVYEAKGDENKFESRGRRKCTAKDATVACQRTLTTACNKILG